jgi:hypothetical protein
MKNLPITKKALVLKYQLWVFFCPYFVTFLDEKFANNQKSPCFKVSTMGFLLALFCDILG